MHKYFILIMILFLSKTTCNPYCQITCPTSKDDLQNGFCDFFHKILKKKVPHDEELREQGKLWLQTEKSRILFLKWLNTLRAFITTGRRPKITKIVGNMGYVNWDMELQYLAELKARYPSLDFNQTCLKSSLNYHVNYIQQITRHKTAELLKAGIEEFMTKLTESWMDFGIDEGGSFNNYYLNLTYHPKVDVVGCAVFRLGQTKTSYVNVSAVCMFGSEDTPLIPLNKTKNSSIKESIKVGEPCSRCRKTSRGCVQIFKEFLLCGIREDYEHEILWRWHSRYWFSKDLIDDRNIGNWILKSFSKFLLVLVFVVHIRVL